MASARRQEAENDERGAHPGRYIGWASAKASGAAGGPRYDARPPGPGSSVGGIAGIVHFDGSSPSRDQARQLGAGVAHRGPHDKGSFYEGGVALLHRRFAVRRNEHPEPWVDDDLVVLTDGRVEGGATALADAWREAGSDGIGRIRGGFAAAIWERRTAALWLVRDAMGTRPLYWARSGKFVAACSELPPMLDLPWVSRTLAWDRIAEHLSFRYVHAPATLVRDISSVPPGHAVRLDASGVRTSRWWSPRWAPPGTPVPDRRETAERMDLALGKAVRRLQEGDQPVGILLSGGLDSSAILHHGMNNDPRPIGATVVLADARADESGFATRVAHTMGAEHRLVRVESQALIGALEQCTRAMGQPLPSAAGVVQHLLFKELATDARVVLSGDGGDEVLGGRAMQQVAARLRRNRVAGRIMGPAREQGRALARRLGLKDLAASHHRFGRDRNIGGSSVFHSHERVALLRDPGLVRPGIRRIILDPLYQEAQTDPLNAILHVWQRGWLPGDSLARSDRMAAHAGLLVRYPLLDREVLELCASLPGAAKVAPRGRGFVTKQPLRLAMEGRLPTALLHRPKRSMPHPLGHWLRTSGEAFLHREVEALCRDDAGVFVPAEIRRMRAAHLAGDNTHGLKLWTLVLFGVWRRVHNI